MKAHEFKIPIHYVPSLIYGDTSNLSGEESDAIIDFEHETSEEHGTGVWTFDIHNTQPYFSQDNDVESLGGEVIDMKYLTEIDNA